MWHANHAAVECANHLSSDSTNLLVSFYSFQWQPEERTDCIPNECSTGNNQISNDNYNPTAYPVSPVLPLLILNESDFEPLITYTPICILLQPDRLQTPLNSLKKPKNPPQAVNLCDKCGKAFPTRRQLAKHKQTHSDGRPFICTICTRRFCKECNLQQHKRTHLVKPKKDYRNFKCDKCDKAFPSGNKLKIHTRTHTGERPYVCDECDLKFSQRSALNRHQIIHTGVHRFFCDRCKKGFYLKANLKKHLRSHDRKLRLKFDKSAALTPSSMNLHQQVTQHTETNGFSIEKLN